LAPSVSRPKITAQLIDHAGLRIPENTGPIEDMGGSVGQEKVLT
jgi:hypothetical protein